MNDFLSVFLNNILPIFLVASIGYGLRARLSLDIKPLSKSVFYAFSPALVFTSLVNSQLPGDEIIDLAVFTVLVTLAMGLLGLVSGRLMKLPRQDTIALILVLMFVNGGNFGLTLNKLRYGDDGLSRAVVYYFTSTILVYTLGVFIASMGRSSWRDSLGKLVRLPAFYAVVLAIVVFNFEIKIPNPVMQALDIASAGAIPVMLVVLGMTMADLKHVDKVRLALPASLMRLLIGPVIAVFVATWLGLTGLDFATGVIEASMPTAVITTILATEFQVRPGMVTSTVVLSTLLSVITLPIVIGLLGI